MRREVVQKNTVGTGKEGGLHVREERSEDNRGKTKEKVKEDIARRTDPIDIILFFSICISDRMLYNVFLQMFVDCVVVRESKSCFFSCF